MVIVLTVWQEELYG